MSPSCAAMIYLVLILLGFLWAFERSEPSAGEIVVVAQLTALCSAARLIFSFVPYFNPVIAIVMLCGFALGGRKGFVVGAMSAFVSNIFLGQGPWTVYQMVSWGIAGLGAGIASKIHLVGRKNWSVRDFIAGCVVSALMIVFVTGPVMDLSSYFLYGMDLKLVLAGGFIFNLTLAASTVVTEVLFGRAFLRAVNRTGSVEKKL